MKLLQDGDISDVYFFPKAVVYMYIFVFQPISLRYDGRGVAWKVENKQTGEILYKHIRN